MVARVSQCRTATCVRHGEGGGRELVGEGEGEEEEGVGGVRTSSEAQCCRAALGSSNDGATDARTQLLSSFSPQKCFHSQLVCVLTSSSPPHQKWLQSSSLWESGFLFPHL